jgi:hypothetical protein
MNNILETPIKVINPWHTKHNIYSRPFFEYFDKPIFTYRGVNVYKNYAGSWDYVLGDTAITQRAGFRKEASPAIIDSLLDGQSPVSDIVADHIKSCGHNPLTYEQYNIEYAAGRMA